MNDPKADQSLNIFDLIDRICGEYRAQWKAGTRPKIEDFLFRVGEDARANLFRNLLHKEIAFRRRHGEEPESTDYLERFASYRTAILEAFGEHTLASMEAMNSTSIDELSAETIVVEPPAANRIGDYELLRELGRGGFGVVYEARHIRRDDRVALKTLPSTLSLQGSRIEEAERLHKFRNEFRSLSEINHPNLVGMLSFESDGPHSFFTMDLVEGSDFLKFTRPNGMLDEERLRAALPQFVEGIRALHERRILHRDLKPSNVLVDRSGQVLILDFGLVVELGGQFEKTVSTGAEGFAGTPRYAAPEQFMGSHTEASDWYAMGTMLYEALNGETPFRGEIAELVWKKQEQDAPAFENARELPSDLADLAIELLNRRPAGRPDCEAILKTVTPGWVDNRSSSNFPSSPDSASRIEVIVGRDDQMAQLESCRERLSESQRPVVAFINGRSGEGKSTLVDQFVKKAHSESDVTVLAGRCFDRESVPMKAFDGVIDSLVDFLRKLSIEESSRLLPEDIGLLARLFPILHRVEAISRMPVDEVATDADMVRYRGAHALYELLGRLAKTRTLVVFIDDLQWGDAASAELLAEFCRKENSPGVLVLGCFRSDEAESSAFLQRWREVSVGASDPIEVENIQVGPLGVEECLQVAAHRLRIEPSQLRKHANELMEDCGGNPYFLEQLLEGFDEREDDFRASPLDELIQTRLARLPDEAVRLLYTIAVSGQPMSIAEASQAAGLKGNALATLTHMRSEKLVRLIGAGESPRAETYHDRIRETVIAGLDDGERREQHQAIAETIESNERLSAQSLIDAYDPISGQSRGASVESSRRIFDLAYHYFESRSEKAFPYQLLAAEEASRIFANRDALEYAKRAEATLSSHSQPLEQYRTHYTLGIASLRRNRTAESSASFRRAVETSSSNLGRARAYCGLSHANLQAGELNNAIQSSTLALNEIRIGNRIGSRFGTLGMFARFPFSLARILLIPYSWQKQTDESSLARANVEMQVYHSRLHYVFERNGFQLIDALIHQMVTAIHVGSPDNLTSGCAAFASVSPMIGLPSIGSFFLKRAKHWAKHANSTVADMLVQLATACVEFAKLHWEEAIESARISFAESRRIGRNHDANLSAHMMRHTYELTGSTSDELEWANRETEIALDASDERTECWGRYGQAAAQARAGRLEEALESIHLALGLLREEKRNLTESICLQSQAFVLLQCSAYREAVEVAEESWSLVRRTMSEGPFSVRACWHRIEASAGPNWNERPDSPSIRVLKKQLRSSLRYNLMIPFQRTLARRCCGRALYTIGRQKRAIRQLELAVAFGREKRFGFDYARALLDLSAVKEEGRDENRADAIALLKKLESVIPRAESWLLGDQYDEAVVAPEFDLTVWEKGQPTTGIEPVARSTG